MAGREEANQRPLTQEKKDGNVTGNMEKKSHIMTKNRRGWVKMYQLGEGSQWEMSESWLLCLIL